METKDKINIAKDFSDTPGARHREDGEFSADEFYEDILLPKFKQAMEDNYILEISLDGLWGMPSSFVSGSFGRLSQEYGADKVLKYISFHSTKTIRKEKVIQIVQDPYSTTIK